MSRPNDTELPSNIDALLTKQQIAAYYRVDPTTIQLWVRTKGMPCVRFGGRLLRFDMTEVKEWERQTRGTKG
jgi:excisionase family DNA binding protein